MELILGFVILILTLRLVRWIGALVVGALSQHGVLPPTGGCSHPSHHAGHGGGHVRSGHPPQLRVLKNPHDGDPDACPTCGKYY